MTTAITTLALLAAMLVAAASGTNTTESKGINPVQHSEGRSDTTTTQNASKGINPVQHSE